jgi:DNA-binding SARP family transcriptional activator
LSCLEFRILGPLEVRRDGEVVPIPAPRQRAVLVALLLQANQVAPAEGLIEKLWGASPPRTARSVLHSLVHRLRRRLEPGSPPAGGLLVTRQLGYLLTLEPGQLDLDQFGDLTERARRAMAAGQPAAAADLFRAALELWRGTPLADVSAAGLEQAAAPWLQEQYMETVEARLAADLAAGRHAEVVGELRSLVATYPLREQLSGQLMTALYRGGRQAEALDRYATLRDLLVTDLGIEPSPDLQRLHRAILAHDPALELAEPAAVPAAGLPAVGSAAAGAAVGDRAVGGSPPGGAPASGPAAGGRAVGAETAAGTGLACQLPSDLVDFTGRGVLAARLRRRLAGTASRQPGCHQGVTISGMPGIGKTALAVHAAHGVRAHFPDGQLFVDLRGTDPQPAEAGLVLGQFLLALGRPTGEAPDGTPARAALYRSLLAGRRVLVVLDNAADEAQVRPLLPPAGCAAVVTSRRPLATLPGLRAYRLAAFTAAEAATLLTRVVPAAKRRGEPSDVAEIAALCGHLPLAVRIAGSRLAARPHWSLRRLADRLAPEHTRLDELAVGDLAVRASLDSSYRGLPAPLRRSFRLLCGVSCPDFAVRLAAAALELPARQAEDALEGLVDAQLAEVAGRDTAGQPRYRLPDLVRIFGRERLDREETSADRRGMLDRALACSLAVTR